MTDEDVERFKAREQKRKYRATERGRSALERDACKRLQGYRRLRDAGFSRADARRFARRADEVLEGAEHAAAE